MRGCSISFSDPHFGDCPIVQAEGYWNFMLCYLKKVRGGGRPMPATDPLIMTITCPFQTYSMGCASPVGASPPFLPADRLWLLFVPLSLPVQVRCMDGVQVSGAERDAAEEAYMEQVLQFNEKIEQVRRPRTQPAGPTTGRPVRQYTSCVADGCVQVEREHEREIAEIESRRRKNMSHAKLLRSKMLASFTVSSTSGLDGQGGPSVACLLLMRWRCSCAGAGGAGAGGPQ